MCYRIGRNPNGEFIIQKRTFKFLWWEKWHSLNWYGWCVDYVMDAKTYKSYDEAKLALEPILARCNQNRWEEVKRFECD